MEIKTLRNLCLGAVILIPQLALAELPLPIDIFGKIEGGLDFCSQVNPQSSAKYQEQKKALVQGASEKEISEARASTEYKEAYGATQDEMSKQPRDEAVKACAAAVETKK